MISPANNSSMINIFWVFLFLSIR